MVPGEKRRSVTRTGLSDQDWRLIREVLARHAGVTGVILFGSRAKGVATPASDIDLVIEGLDDPLQAEAIARELDDLPLPYRFDVKALSDIRSPDLLAHIERVGIRVYG